MDHFKIEENSEVELIFSLIISNLIQTNIYKVSHYLVWYQYRVHIRYQCSRHFKIHVLLKNGGSCTWDSHLMGFGKGKFTQPYPCKAISWIWTCDFQVTRHQPYCLRQGSPSKYLCFLGCQNNRIKYNIMRWYNKNSLFWHQLAGLQI